jgi:hypothetical protein
MANAASGIEKTTSTNVEPFGETTTELPSCVAPRHRHVRGEINIRTGSIAATAKPVDR